MSDKIKCVRCVEKPRRAFTTTQLASPTTAVCIECGPKRLDELECDWCEEWKVVTDFSSVQRKLDDPTCKKCIDEKMNM